MTGECTQESPSLVKGAGMRSQSVTVRRFESCLLHHITTTGARAVPEATSVDGVARPDTHLPLFALPRQRTASTVTPNAQKAGVRGTTVADDQTLRKVTKLLARVERHIETTKDALQDLEIEFEVLKATVARLDPNVVSNDIENSSNTTGTGMRKF